jgi:hypothetical protein
LIFEKEDEMKKLLVVMLVLGMASMANAALLISVNGTIDPPDTSITISPSDELVIDIWGDGQTGAGHFYMGLLLAGAEQGSLDIDNVTILYPGNTKFVVWDSNPDVADFLGIAMPYVDIELNDIPDQLPLGPGVMVDGIIFHCEHPSDVTIGLWNIDGELMDMQVIHQPEPMTIVLLGLGGLLLRRRK